MAQIEVRYDKFEDLTTISSGDFMNVKDAEWFKVAALLSFKGQNKTQLKESETVALGFSINTISSDLERMKSFEDGDIIFLLDDAKRISGKLKLIKSEKSGSYAMTSYFGTKISYEQFKKIASSKKVEFKWAGLGEFPLRSEVQKKFQEITAYVEK